MRWRAGSVIARWRRSPTRAKRATQERRRRVRRRGPRSGPPRRSRRRGLPGASSGGVGARGADAHRVALDPDAVDVRDGDVWTSAASRPGSISRSPWWRRTSDAMSRSTRRGSWWSSSGAPAANPSSAEPSPPAGDASRPPRAPGLDRRPPRRRPLGRRPGRASDDDRAVVRARVPTRGEAHARPPVASASASRCDGRAYRSRGRRTPTPCPTVRYDTMPRYVRLRLDGVLRHVGLDSNAGKLETRGNGSRRDPASQGETTRWYLHPLEVS
jgi:hypothetical protein